MIISKTSGPRALKHHKPIGFLTVFYPSFEHADKNIHISQMMRSKAVAVSLEQLLSSLKISLLNPR